MTPHTPKGPLRGIVPAIVTPFRAGDGVVDLAGVRWLCRFLAEAGVDGLFVGGTTGEGVLLSADERMALAEAAAQAAPVPVVVHVGARTTAETVILARHASGLGVAGAAVMTPYFYPLDSLALECHFAAAAEAAPQLPRYVYTIPQFTNNPISPDLAARLCTAHGYVGIKYSLCDMEEFRQFVETVPGDILIGCDSQILAALRLGAAGTVSGGASALPEIFVRLYAAFRSGRSEEAERTQAVIASIDRLVGSMPFIGTYKTILHHRGVIAHPDPRPPLRRVTGEEWAALAQVVHEAAGLYV